MEEGASEDWGHCLIWSSSSKC
ncbi:hypothetical protein ZEAMMB73_Zm00001d025332 [Zea mays]|uniref:Uncharacterized protein n=1 Tax=Zea mays TaxID=4577 RepID=A0A1D6J6J1_MAIZE|nr:hypothetical protein ZEAMMB73_Zm00001d025332 [Zea mays]